MGTMTMELGGKVSIVCSKTGYTAELEFKLRVSILTHIEKKLLKSYEYSLIF